jgi:hypothetical protein
LPRGAGNRLQWGYELKLLMIYIDKFTYKTSVKNLESAPFIDEEKVIEDALLGFIHVEPEDEENLSSIETKLIKNLKWAARKNETDKVVLCDKNYLFVGRSVGDYPLCVNGKGGL